MPFRYACDECEEAHEESALCPVCSTARELVLKQAEKGQWIDFSDCDLEGPYFEPIYTVCLNCCPGHKTRETP